MGSLKLVSARRVLESARRVLLNCEMGCLKLESAGTVRRVVMGNGWSGERALSKHVRVERREMKEGRVGRGEGWLTRRAGAGLL